jgi:hypothetical protein
MKKLLIIIFSLAGMVLTSCLKDKNIEDMKYGTKGIGDHPIVLFPNSSEVWGLDASNKDTTFRLLTVRLAEPNPASEDVKVTLTLNNDLVTNAGYDVPASTKYSLDNLVVTIPKGSREGYVNITTKTANLLDGSYALGFTVSSVSNPKYTIASQKDFLGVILVKNKYDGKYILKGAFYHPTSSPGYTPFTIDAELHTSGPNSVKIWIPDLDGYYGPGLFNGALNAFGSQEPEITIDPATNKATVQNSYVGAVTFYQMAPGYDSHYDPATKKIFVKYGYNYSPGPVFNPAANREWTYEFDYVGPR